MSPVKSIIIEWQINWCQQMQAASFIYLSYFLFDFARARAFDENYNRNKERGE